MLTILFWNVLKDEYLSDTRPENQSRRTRAEQRYQRITRAIAELAATHQVDVCLLAEWRLPSQPLLTALNNATQTHFREAEPDQCAKINIYLKSSVQDCFSVAGAGDARYTVRHLIVPNRKSLLMVVGHFDAQSLSWNKEDQNSYFSREVAPAIERAEYNLQHDRTVLIGDLNLNPYDPGVTSAFALHGVMTRALARKERIIHGKAYKRFYNPMWKHFHPSNENAPAGTLYFDSGPSTHFWHIFDQVLLRSTLLPGFRDNDLTIVTQAGAESLVSRQGRPARNAFSDHLPILFKLTLEEETANVNP